jgi:putative protein kinase ArgK-like GTPase of G3E family
MRVTLAVGAAVSMAGLFLAPTGISAAQPGGSSSAQDTIRQLEADGYDVIVDRVGSGPIDECIVTDVRHPQTLTQTIVTGHDHNRDVVTVVVSKSIHVTLNCDH